MVGRGWEEVGWGGMPLLAGESASKTEEGVIMKSRTDGAALPR